MAPHGGRIEPGTTEIADLLAGDDHTFYSFEGLKPSGNWELHLPSICFDEPLALQVLDSATMALVVHGCRGDEDRIYLGGLDLDLKRRIGLALAAAGLVSAERDGILGRHAQNICNRCSSGMGVQLEIPAGFRRESFSNLWWRDHERSPNPLRVLVSAVRSAMISVFDAPSNGLRYPLP
jgi:phage replication-related protein YjqB (UPF0714/DUF867 family)